MSAGSLYTHPSTNHHRHQRAMSRERKKKNLYVARNENKRRNETRPSRWGRILFRVCFTSARESLNRKNIELATRLERPTAGEEEGGKRKRTKNFREDVSSFLTSAMRGERRKKSRLRGSCRLRNPQERRENDKDKRW